MSLSDKLLPLKPDEKENEPLKSWALVELFGHQRIVGYLTEQSFGTGVLFRVDVPDLTKGGEVVRAGFTRYFGLSSIYSITPIDEQAVRKLLPIVEGSPAVVRPYSFPRSYDNDEESFG
jgi:hypothetical protein